MERDDKDVKDKALNPQLQKQKMPEQDLSGRDIERDKSRAAEEHRTGSGSDPRPERDDDQGRPS